MLFLLLFIYFGVMKSGWEQDKLVKLRIIKGLNFTFMFCYLLQQKKKHNTT